MSFDLSKDKKISILINENFKNDLLIKMDDVMNILWPEFCNSDLLSFDPMLDMQESLDSYSFEMQLPAENKEDFQILIEDKYLFITDRDENESQKILFSNVKMEKKCKVFLRAIALPSDVDKDNIIIDFKDGFLYINIKKKEIWNHDC